MPNPNAALSSGDKFPEGDPVEVRPPDSRAESQAGLNGPSGSPTSPSGRVSPAASRRVQVEAERDVNLFTGKEIVRVKYRPEGTRRWTRLVVVPDPDQTVDELLRECHLIAQAHMARAAS